MLIEKLGSTCWYPRTNNGQRTHTCRPWYVEAKEKRCVNCIHYLSVISPLFLSFTLQIISCLIWKFSSLLIKHLKVERIEMHIGIIFFLLEFCVFAFGLIPENLAITILLHSFYETVLLFCLLTGFSALEFVAYRGFPILHFFKFLSPWIDNFYSRSNESM